MADRRSAEPPRKERERPDYPSRNLALVVPVLLAALLGSGAVWSFVRGVPIQGAASAINALLLLYAVTRFIGWRFGWEDIRAQVRLPRSVRSRRSAPKPG